MTEARAKKFIFISLADLCADPCLEGVNPYLEQLKN